MNDFMRLVPRYWYRMYQGLMMTFSGLIIAISILFATTPSIWHYETGFHYVAVSVFAAIHILYGVTAYWMLKRTQEPLATLLSVFIFGLLALAGLDQATSPVIRIIFLAGWLAAAFLNGMYGLPLLFGTSFLALMYSLTQVHFSLNDLDWLWWVMPAGSATLATIGYTFWRRRYIGPQQEEIDRLSNMLHSNQQQSLILLESLVDGVIVADRDGIITAANTSAIAMVGEAGNQLRNQSADKVVGLRTRTGAALTPDDNPFTRVLKSRQHVSGTYRVSNGAGVERVISLLVSPIIISKSGAFVGVIAVMRDISKEYAIEQERINFVNTASHEMRTPLATVEGYLSLVLHQKADVIPNKQVLSYLEHSYMAVRHLGQLFRDLLTTSQVERGELDNSPEVVDIQPILNQTIKEYSARSSVPIRFVNNAQHPDNTDFRVYADPTRLRQVVGNLLDNAMKYTSAGEITVSLSRIENTIRFSVQDTGSGIPQEDMPKLFKKFSRLDNSDTRTIGGTGLGLYVCKKIIELYGGKIWVESTFGRGSSFIVELPSISDGVSPVPQLHKNTSEEVPSEVPAQ